jgi:two-component system sensor histidine kinase KdpD
VENACDEADRMNRLVANLLDMTRLQAGAIEIVYEPCDVQDLIGVALADLADKLQDHPVMVDVPPDLPLAPLDFVLISHVLLNLLDNAHKYSAPDTPIEIRARMTDDRLQISVADRGLGIPTEDLSRVFEKFYRVPRADEIGGTGLGLSICQGIVEAHGGRIWVVNRSGGGAVVTLTRPMEHPISVAEEIV